MEFAEDERERGEGERGIFTSKPQSLLRYSIISSCSVGRPICTTEENRRHVLAHLHCCVFPLGGER